MKNNKKPKKLSEKERVLKFLEDYKALSPFNKELLKFIANENQTKKEKAG